MISDEKVLSALITAPNIRTASKICGLSESGIYARLRKPQFKALYDTRRLMLLDDCYGQLLQHISSAVETLGELAKSASSEQVRLNASESIIRCSLRLNEEINVLRRLEALEAMHDAES